MLRMSNLVLFALLAVAGAAQIGCRACSDCYDYSSPVANCHCDSCGGGRSGSAFAGGCDGYCQTEPADEPDAEYGVAQQPTDKTTR